MTIETYTVSRVEPKLLHELILTKHYAQRLPSISFAFGLFEGERLVGGLTVGKPASASLCVGVCGPENSSKVYELNRLILLEGLPANSASMFVGKALKALKGEDLVIVSYADSGMGHHGYVYQATNFIYTGKTKGRTDKYTPGNKHSRHYTDEYNHLRKVRTEKHRYIFFTNRRNKALRESLRYPIEHYPKGNNDRYQLGTVQKTVVLNRNTGETHLE